MPSCTDKSARLPRPRGWGLPAARLLLAAWLLPTGGEARSTLAARGAAPDGPEAGSALTRQRLLFFTSAGSPWCQRLRSTTLGDPDLAPLLRAVTIEEIDVDREPAQAARYQVRGVPTLVLLAPDGQVRRTLNGFVSPADLRNALQGQAAAPSAPADSRALKVLLGGLATGALTDAQWAEAVVALGEAEQQKAVHDALLAVAPFPRAKLVPLLAHPRLAVRLGALDLLEEVAGDTFGFDPWRADDEESRRALAEWRAWAGATTTGVATVFAAMPPGQVTTYVQDLLADNADRAHRARRMLIGAGAAIEPDLAKALREHPEWPDGARSRVREVRYAVLLPYGSRAAREAAAHRLAFGALDEKLRALGELAAAGQRVAPLLAEFLDDQTPIVRETAVDALIQAGGARAVPQVGELLKRETDGEVVFVALRGLGAIRQRPAQALLAGYVQNPNEDLAIVALQSLVRSRATAAAPAIGACLADPRWRVRIAALEAVTKLQLKTLRGGAEKCLDDSDEFVRFAAVQAIAAIAQKDKTVLAKLTEKYLAEDGLKGPVTAALVSMDILVPRSFGAALKGKGPDVLLAVLEALGEADDASWQLADEFVEHPDPDVACAAVRLLSHKGLTEPAYRGRIVAILRGGSREKLLAALSVLDTREARSSRSGSELLDDLAETAASAPPAAQAGLKELFDAFLGKDARTNAPRMAAVTLPDLFAAFGETNAGASAAGAAVSGTGGKWADLADALRPLLERKADAELRFAAACALLPLDAARAAPVLLDGLAARTLEDRLRAVSALSALRQPLVPVLPLLSRLLADPAEVVRREAAGASTGSDKDPRGLELLLAELDRPGALLRAEEACSYELRNGVSKPAGRAKAGAWARRTLASATDADRRTLALCLLDACWEVDDVRLIEPDLKSTNTWHRRAAWHALASNARDAFAQRAGEVAADPSEHVRLVVPATLDRETSSWEWLFDEQRRAQVSYWSSSRRKFALTEPARLALQTAARDPSPRVRMEAGFALLSHFEPVDLSEFADTLERIPDKETVHSRVSSYLRDNYRRLGPGFRLLLPYIDPDDVNDSWVLGACAQFNYNPDAAVETAAHQPRAESKRAAVTATYLDLPVARVDTNAPLRVVYFTSPGCSECAQVETWWPELRTAFPRLELEVYSIKKVDAMRLNETLCERFDIPERFRLVAPAVFCGGGGLVKTDVTLDRVGRLLARAEGVPDAEWYDVRPERLAQASREIARRYSSFGIGVVAAGGALDGINPCAFATIIFFLSYLQIARRSLRETIQVSLAFILGVFIAYLALGLGFVELVTRFDLLRRLGGWLNRGLAGFALLIFALSLRDGVLCLKGRAQEMTLQLPALLKSGIHSAIRQGTRHARFVCAAFVVGIVVSVLELACTGQVYAPTILFMLKTGAGRASALGYLVIYNLAFIAPLLVVFALGVLGLRQATLTRFFQRHVAFVKFATAALFLVLFLFFIYGSQLLAWLSQVRAG